MKLISHFLLAFLGLSGARGAAAGSAETNLFKLTSDFPKYVTCHIEFHDPTGKKWPNFFYGKPATNGFLRYDLQKPSASFRLRCDQQAQKNGDQSRRVLGEFLKIHPSPMVVFAVTNLSRLRSKAPEGKQKERWHFTGLLQGVLILDDRQIPIQSEGNFRFHDGKGDEKRLGIMGETAFFIPAGAAGLQEAKLEETIQIRVAFTGYRSDQVGILPAR